MGKISVVFVTVLTCIFLISQIPQIEGTGNSQETQGEEDCDSSQENPSLFSSDEDNKDINQGQRNVRINGYAEGNVVFFNASHFNPCTDQYTHKLYSLACESSLVLGIWEDIKKNWLSTRIPLPPYTNVTFQIREKATGRIIGTNSTVTPAKEPVASVRSLQCTRRRCMAIVENNCMKYNGNNVTVQLTLKPSSEKLKTPLVTPVKSGPTVMISLIGLDLLPFTNYTVTASLANNVGAATDPSFSKQTSFITKSEKPGRVSSLAVTQSTPSSLHVVWTAPDDHPPKGRLSQYKLQWRILGATTNNESKIVNESVTSFNITGLAPTTTYEITVSAKNANVQEYGEAKTVTITTKEEAAADPKSGTEEIDKKTTLRFSWNASRRNSGETHHYKVIFSDGDNETDQTTTDTHITLADLTPGKKYTLVVQACSAAGHCDQLTTLENWTRPEQPRVVEKTELQKTTDTTLTIQLPVLQNPPGWFWVLLKKYSGVRDENVPEEAVAMVLKEREKETKKSKETQAKTRKRRSANPDRNDDSWRIATKVEVVEGQEPEKIVVVGGDWNGGDGLEGDTDYVVFIVTETKAGPYSEYRPSKPRVMRTAKRPKEPALLGMISGLCGAALLFICFFTMLAVKRKKNRAVFVTKEKESL